MNVVNLRKGLDNMFRLGYNPNRTEQNRTEQNRTEQNRTDRITIPLCGKDEYVKIKYVYKSVLCL